MSSSTAIHDFLEHWHVDHNLEKPHYRESI